ncbi:hypothetical protein [Spirillospora sp. NPDC029432]|uniref:hypothetical protein n=1 Tax=Spirillospora sp. NPDC029432 TaxID=3154599 RepID=UPI003452D673
MAPAVWSPFGGPSDVPVRSIAGVSIGPNMLHVVDEQGTVWSCEVWGDPPDGFFNPAEYWTSQGTPAAGVTAAADVGVLDAEGSEPRPTWVFVIGSDRRLWARTAEDVGGAAHWTWVDHGAPDGNPIKTGVAPIAVDAFGGSPAVHVLADDGRLWMRSMSGDGWRWRDRGVPEGWPISAIVGAAALPTDAEPLPIAAVATGDGHLWISTPDGDSFNWSDLGTPAPEEKVVAGIGIEVVTEPTASRALNIVVLGSPGGQVWTCRWEPGKPPSWKAHGRPADARIRSAVGTASDPADEAGCLISVIGNDHQVWVIASASPGAAWSRWDPPSDATTVAAGRAVMLGRPCAVVLDAARRVHIVTPATGFADEEAR